MKIKRIPHFFMLLSFIFSWNNLWAINQASFSQFKDLSGKLTLFKESSNCGKIYISNERQDDLFQGAEWISIPGEQVLKYKRKFPWIKKKPTDEFSYRTPQGMLVINRPDLLNEKKSVVKKYMRQLLEQELKNEVQKRFDAETNGLELLESDKVNHYLSKMTSILFPKNNKHPSRQIRLYMAMYPELYLEITGNPDHKLRPLFCQYQQKQHNIKIAKRWGHVIVIPALALGVTSIIIGSEGVVLVPLAVAAGATAVLVGVKDIGYGIYNVWHTEKAAYLAKRQKLIYKEIEKAIKHLEKKDKEGQLLGDELKLAESIRQLQNLKTDERKKQLDKLCRKVHFNRMLIAFGILNAGFNGVNLSGDPTILGSLPGLIVDWIGL